MAMRCCALRSLLLVALLKVQALRTQPLEFAAAGNGGQTIPGELYKDEDKDTDVQMQPRDWSRLSSGEEAFMRLLTTDADVDDDRNDYYDYPDEQFRSIERLERGQLTRLYTGLLKALQRANIYEAPLLFLKLDEKDPYPLDVDADMKSVVKRTRGYRRYPWKRKNSKNYESLDYDPYNSCILTRKDVFKLLVALHDARQGNKSRTVNFCNRKRPASAVYTNIRFLGRRRK